jgi:hypothetical protein
MNRLGLRTPGVDRSLFTSSRCDSVLKTPERMEIDKMLQWIDAAFPPDLSYSGTQIDVDVVVLQRPHMVIPGL